MFFFAGHHIRQKKISWSISLRHSCFAIPVLMNIESNLVSNIAFALIDLLPLIKVIGMTEEISNSSLAYGLYHTASI